MASTWGTSISDPFSEPRLPQNAPTHPCPAHKNVYILNYRLYFHIHTLNVYIAHTKIKLQASMQDKGRWGWSGGLRGFNQEIHLQGFHVSRTGRCSSACFQQWITETASAWKPQCTLNKPNAISASPPCKAISYTPPLCTPHVWKTTAKGGETTAEGQLWVWEGAPFSGYCFKIHTKPEQRKDIDWRRWCARGHDQLWPQISSSLSRTSVALLRLKPRFTFGSGLESF